MTTITVSIATGIPASFFDKEVSVPVVVIQTSDEDGLFVLGTTAGDDDATIESNVRDALDNAPFGQLPLGFIGTMTSRPVLDSDDFKDADLRVLFTKEVEEDEE